MIRVDDESTVAPTEADLLSAGVRFTHDGPIAEITLCRPERRNAQSPAMWRALAALGRAMPSEVRILIVRAEGPSFSAGLDRSMLTVTPGTETLAGLLEGPDAALTQAIHDFQDGFLFLRDRNFISIAVVQGHAVGAGFQLALACDLRIVADDASFRMREPALGLVPDLTGLVPLVRQVGYGRALEICTRARAVDATEAAALGLAHSVVPIGDLEREVQDWTRALLQADTGAARELKALLQSAEVCDLEQQRRLEGAAQARLLRALAATTDGPGRKF
jgi:enoyl-CoA hydratase/carnithine racemase